MEVHPAHVLTALVTFGLPVLGLLYRISRSLSRLEMRVEILWTRSGIEAVPTNGSLARSAVGGR